MTHRPRGALARGLDPAVLAGLLLFCLLTGGTLGYMAVEGWTLWEAFYMTVISLTTVGYREVRPLSRQGEVFTAALLLLGVGTLFYTVTLFVARFVEAGLKDKWARRRQSRMLDQLDQHFIVCGYGRIGATIVEEFRHHKAPYVVIDRNGERVQEVLLQGGLAVEADASSEEVLKRVRIDRARGLITAVSTDAENVYTVLSARLLRPDLLIIARAGSDDAFRKLKRAGADRVISPYQIGGLQMAQTALRPAVVDFVHLATSSDHLDLAMEQVRIHPDAALADQTIGGANLRQRFGVVVVGVLRAEGKMDFNPAPDTVMRPGDQLVVLGPPDRVKQFEEATASRAGR
jgi:voltage-gated potassium channel